MRMKNRLAALVAAGGIATAGLVAAPAVTLPGAEAPAAVAQAGDCTIPSLSLCGKIRNSTQSAYSLRVTGDYGSKVPNTLIGAGVNAPYVDDDGWFLPGYRTARVCIGQETPDACYTTSSNGWHKTQDSWNTVIVRITYSSTF